MPIATLLQITDTHLLSDKGARLLGVDTSASMWAVVEAALGELSPDAIVVSGDIVHEGEAETYAELDRTLRSSFGGEVRYACGNHDFIDAMHEAGLDQSNLELENFTLVIADTHAEGETEGEFTPRDQSSLIGRLRQARTEHIVVAGHHAPVEIGTPWLDAHRIRGSDLLLDCLNGDNRVRGYVFGHIHQEFSRIHQGLPLFATPSTCFQFLPGSERFRIDSRNAGYRCLLLHDNGRVETEVHRVPGVPVELAGPIDGV